MNNRYEDMDKELRNLSEPYWNKKNIPDDNEKGKKMTKDGKGRLPKGNGTESLFNRYSIFFLNEGIIGKGGENEGILNKDSMDYFENPNNWRKSYSSVLEHIRELTTQNIITFCSDGEHNGMDYEWSDFLYASGNEIIPNNRLITLRRFPYPVGDNLLSKVSCPAPDIARAVTWLDEENNKLDEILKFEYGFTWKELQSDIQEEERPTWGREGDAIGGRTGQWLNYATEIMNGDDKKIIRGDTKAAENFDPLGKATNLVLGSLDVIKEMYIRDKGLKFSQEITIKFEYDLKSIDGIDPRVAFLDLLSNLLIMTFNRGEFWGGDVRFYGGRQRKNLLGDKAYEDLAKGDFASAFNSATGSIISKFKALIGGATNLKDAISAFGKNVLSGVGNLLIGGSLDKLGRPQMLALQAFLTGEPTGFWHLTVGNPFAPILSCGNMILDKSDLKFSGNMGHHDFPTKMILECTLKHGRPRDRSDMMSMFAPQVGRTYYTEPPQSLIEAMNRKKGSYGGVTATDGQPKSIEKSNQSAVNKEINELFKSKLKDSSRFPNHNKNDETKILMDKRIAWAAQWTT